MRAHREAALALCVGAALVLPASGEAQVPPASQPQSPSQSQPRAQSGGGDAVAGFESAGELLRKCRENSTFSRSYCFAYLAAVADASRSYRVWIGSGDPCLPTDLTLGKLADIFEAYLIANPSQTRAQAASVIVASLQEAFPCAAPATLPPATAPAPEPAAPVVPSDARSE